MAEPVNGLQDPYLATLEISTSEHFNIYNKAIVGLPESDRYDLTVAHCTTRTLETIDNQFAIECLINLRSYL